VAAAEGGPHATRGPQKVLLPKLHDEDVYDVSGLLALHSIDGLGDVFSRVVVVQVADALDALGNLSVGEQEPLPGGLTTPTLAAQVQRCLDSATTSTTTTTTAYAAPTGAVETASLSVYRPPERKWEAMAARWKRKWSRPHPPESHQCTCRETPPTTKPAAMARGPASQRPSPYSAAEPSLLGTPAFSSPPASQQQQW
jgi:hypothetical protein